MTDYVWWVRGREHAELCALSVASVRRVDPKAACYVYTDDADKPDIPGAILCAMPPGRPAMVANLDAQVKHLLTSKDYGAAVLFLDSDTLLCKPFPFDESSELWPTWRTHVLKKEEKEIAGLAKIMPYNYGVLGARVCSNTMEAFIWMKSRIQNMAPAHQNWYGNQFALYELCGHPSLGERSLVPIPWVPGESARLRVHRLPCEVWNYTPEKAGEPVEDKGILHFKGGRKDLMEAYA